VTGRTQPNDIRGIPKIAIKKSLAISVSAVSGFGTPLRQPTYALFMSRATLTFEVSMSFRQYLQELFDDMRDCAEQIAADRDAFFRRFPLVPPNISIGDGRRIFVSEKSLVAIQKIARLYRGNTANYRRALSGSDMADLISLAIGSVIGDSVPTEGTQFPIPDDPQMFWIALRDQLTRDITKLNLKRTHLFGAWVIQGDSIPVIAVGPCRNLRAGRLGKSDQLADHGRRRAVGAQAAES
jgi:hypothetical protein